MTEHIKHISILLLSCMAFSGCHSDRNDGPDATDGRMVNYTISIYAGDPEPVGSRGGELGPEDYFEEPDWSFERMRTLRVILVRPDGEIEHNVRLYNTIPDAGLGQYSNIRLKVVGGEKKQVYLFANESSISNNDSVYDFDLLMPGSKFPTEELNGYILKGIAGKPLYDNNGSNKQYLPMSEQFEINVLEPDNEGNNLEQSDNLFITRAAVKFSFHVQATDVPLEPYSISELTVSKLGNAEYLLPKSAVYVPSKYPTSTSDRYIKSYDVPAEAELFEYSFHPTEFKFTTDYKPGTVIDYAPQIYFSETAISDNDPVILKLRLDDDAEYAAEVPMPNLPVLPRNTHVKVNITLSKSDVKCTVDVVPYASVPLNPEFGFDELLPRPPVDTGEMPPWIVIPKPDDSGSETK